MSQLLGRRVRNGIGFASFLFLALSAGDFQIFAADAEKKGSVARERNADAELKKFLASTEGTYGWSPAKGTISYDFFPDGRLHIQGPEGEATMWQGKWSLAGDQLKIVNSDTKKTKTVTAVRSGKDLLLDGELYRRYRPE